MLKRTLLSLLFAGAAGAALAHEGHEHKDEHKMMGKMELPAACAADAEKACPGMTPGDGRFGPCMKEHKDSMSEGCRDAMKAMHEGKKGKGDWKKKIAEACGADAAKHCAGMEPGDGKYHPCLMEHKDELSESCQGFMKEMHAGKKGKMMKDKGPKPMKDEAPAKPE